MYKSIFIFLLLCFCGAETSYVFGEVNSNSDNKHVLTAMDVDTEGEKSLNDLLKSLPGFDVGNNLLTWTFSYLNADILSVNKPSVTALLLGNKLGTQPPLFLLFHSFIFYDLFI